MSKFIDPEFAKSLIQDCEKIIATLKEMQTSRPEAEKMLFGIKIVENDSVKDGEVYLSINNKTYERLQQENCPDALSAFMGKIANLKPEPKAEKSLAEILCETWVENYDGGEHWDNLNEEGKKAYKAEAEAATQYFLEKAERVIDKVAEPYCPSDQFLEMVYKLKEALKREMK